MQRMDINEDAVRKALGAYAATTSLKTFGQIDSTNQWFCDHPPTSTGMVVAARQSNGRGRRGRKWQSPDGGIYFSIGQRLANTALVPPALSLVVGITLAETLTRIGAADVLVKWPNDVVVKGQKLAGVLVERSSQVLIVGIGLNWHSLALPPDSPTDRAAIGLVDCVAATHLPAKESVCGQLAKNVLDVLALPGSAIEGFLAERWSQWDALADKAVTIDSSDGSSFDGVGSGVTAAGALRLLTGRGMVEVHSGDARVRGGWERAS